MLHRAEKSVSSYGWFYRFWICCQVRCHQWHPGTTLAPRHLSLMKAVRPHSPEDGRDPLCLKPRKHSAVSQLLSATLFLLHTKPVTGEYAKGSEVAEDLITMLPAYLLWEHCNNSQMLPFYFPRQVPTLLQSPCLLVSAGVSLRTTFAFG